MVLDTAWVALSLLPQIGYKTLSALINTFGSTYDVLLAERDDLMQVRGIGKKIAQSIFDIDLARVALDIHKWQQAGVQIVPLNKAQYPQMLSNIADPPPTLFMLGDFENQSWERTIAIVGTRNPSQPAAYVASKLGKILAKDNWTIVSGLALGIDRMGHEGALNHNQGRTIAVLGSGVLNVYPPENQTLAKYIAERGLLLSENHPHASPKAARLVTRNRLISALSQHIIVVESSANGGAMHAARAAIKQGRTLHTFDFPASGNQELLRNGANCLNTDLSQIYPSLNPSP